MQFSFLQCNFLLPSKFISSPATHKTLKNTTAFHTFQWKCIWFPSKNIWEALIPTFHAQIDKKFYALSRRVLLRVTSAFREYRSTLCQSATGIAIMHSLRWMINRANLDKFYCDRQAFLIHGWATTRRIITFNDCPMATLLFASFLLSPSWVSRHRGDTNLIASNENLMPAEIPAARFSVPNGLEIHPMAPKKNRAIYEKCEARALDWMYGFNCN